MSDAIEHEGKILDIDVAALEARLEELSATKHEEQYFRRYVFDTIPLNENRWVRLRTDGTKATVAVKEISSDATTGTEEWESGIADFDAMLTILKKIGIEPRGYQENRRQNYTLPLGEVSIDYWPKLQPYVEFEANSQEDLAALVQMFGYTLDDLTGMNTDKLYKNIGIDLQQTPELKF